MAEDKILKKLNNHDKQFVKINERFDDHDKKFVEIDKRFDSIDKKLDDHDAKFERVFTKILQLENKIDSVESGLSAKIDASQDRILSAIDSVIKKNSDIDIEQVSTRTTLDRHQEEIDLNKKEISKIKKVIKLAT